MNNSQDIASPRSHSSIAVSTSGHGTAVKIRSAEINAACNAFFARHGIPTLSYAHSAAHRAAARARACRS